MARAKSIILDGVKDHVVPHIAEKDTANVMWEALTKLYQHTSVQRKILLENQLQSYQMQKGEQIDTFLVSEDWVVFVQSILGRSTLPDWEELWAALCQEEIRRLNKAGRSGKGVRIKKEEEVDVALASEGKQGKRKKKDLSKVKCFHCGELGHYAS
eukprot:PITA_28620